MGQLWAKRPALKSGFSGLSDRAEAKRAWPAKKAGNGQSNKADKGREWRLVGLQAFQLVFYSEFFFLERVEFAVVRVGSGFFLFDCGFESLMLRF